MKRSDSVSWNGSLYVIRKTPLVDCKGQPKYQGITHTVFVPIMEPVLITPPLFLASEGINIFGP